MYALSLTQPYATLIGIGQKKIETRSWSTTFRGPIAIHASKGFPKWAKETCFEEPFYSMLEKAGYASTYAQLVKGGQNRLTLGMVGEWSLPLGSIIALADLVDCQPTAKLVDAFRACKFGAEIGEQELPFGDFSPGRYGFILTNVRPLKEAVPCKGVLNLWTVPTDVENQVNYQIADALT